MDPDDNPFCDLPAFFWFFLDIPEEFKGEWWQGKLVRLLTPTEKRPRIAPWGGLR